MARKSLHVVTDQESPAPEAEAEVMTVTQAAAHGTQRDLLIAIRDRVAEAVESRTTPPRDLAALTKRLADLTREIAALDAEDWRREVSADVGDGQFDAAII